MTDTGRGTSSSSPPAVSSSATPAWASPARSPSSPSRTPFVLCVAAAAFFSTLVAEYYGAARSSENYAAVYTAKVPGGVVGGTVAGALVVALGWSVSFYLGAVLLVLAGLGTLSLRPVGVDAPARTGPTPDD